MGMDGARSARARNKRGRTSDARQEDPRRGVSRRAVLVGAAGVAACPVLPGGGAALAAPATGAGPRPKPVPGPAAWKHAVGDPRGSDISVTVGRSAEARYGAMFKTLPAFSPADELLTGLAESMVEKRGPLSDVSLSDDGLDN